MTLLTIDDFSARVGEAFEVLAEEGAVKLRLDRAEITAWSEARQDNAFRLLWSGPAQTELLQGTYIFRNGQWEDAIMIVPIARQADEIRYESIFN